VVIRDPFAEDGTGPVAESRRKSGALLSILVQSRSGLQTSLVSPLIGEMMKWENIAGLSAGFIGVLVIAFALFNGPIGTSDQPPKQSKIEAPKAPETPVRGPVVRDITPK
jgi:hypothetical protein